jgi:predicted TIM-barrel fold metal-dependent hydrolase
MIIDIHTHAFPDELAPRAMEVLTGNSGVQPFSDGTCAGLRASMRRAGIDKSAVMPIATKPGQARSVNRWAAEVNRANDGLICFGSIHPLQEDWQAEIDALVADGIVGVKFHPDYQQFFVDEPQFVPLYRALADAGLIVLFHAGVDIGLPPPVHCTPDRLARLLDAVPELTVIAAHMGGYSCWDKVERYLVGRNLYFDTCYSLTDLGPERMASLMRAHGLDRILFATDSPWTDQSAELAGIRALSLSEDEIAAVLGGNAVRVLGL